MNEFKADAERLKKFNGLTGIYVRARHDKRWINADIMALDAESLAAFLRSRGSGPGVEWAASTAERLAGALATVCDQFDIVVSPGDALPEGES